MSKDNLFNQDTKHYQTDDELKTLKSAKINASASMPRLEVRGQSKVLSNKAFSIGRDKSNQLIIADAKVSKFHAVVSFENNTAYIKDTDSTNGTYLNNEKLIPRQKVKLNNGDKIKVGNTVIIYYK
ncbi:MAG: FHA domain-containing protein [Spirochaetes bacterium]|nr:FHA domain-containing protein [Spirochaetota bacterium]